jgi:hypothetical protein
MLRASGTLTRATKASLVAEENIVVLAFSLLSDIWSNLAGFLEVADFFHSLLTTSKQIHSTVDQDIIYEEKFAKRKLLIRKLDIS